MSIEVVFFDFGGTLAQRGRRRTFVSATTVEDGRRLLKTDALFTLSHLKANGYRLGLLSNTTYTREQMDTGLRTANIYHLFNYFVYSSDQGMCRKPCARIFETAQQSANVAPDRILHVGDNYEIDIIGAINSGWKAAYLVDNHFDYLLSRLGVQTFTVRNLSNLLKYL